MPHWLSSATSIHQPHWARVDALFAEIPAGPAAQPLQITEPPQRGEKRVVVKKATPIERLLIAFQRRLSPTRTLM